MKLSSIVIGLSFLLGLGGTASAQSLFEDCRQKKQDIEQMRQQAEQMKAGLTDIDNKVRDLERQKRELLREKHIKTRDMSKLEKKIRIDTSMMKRMCAGLRQCDALEQKIDKLRERVAPLADRLRKIRKEIRERSAESARLNREVDKIEASYSQLNCDNLVAGSTAQSTIDRCNGLFSDWNKMQKDINLLETSVVALRTRYQKVMNKMRVHNAELARLLKKMRTSCRHSQRLVDLENLEKENKSYASMRDELDDMEKKVRRIRKLKMVRHKMKPKKKGHGLKPVKKKPTLKKIR